MKTIRRSKTHIIPNAIFIISTPSSFHLSLGVRAGLDAFFK
jgi:hypothetical protein